MSHERKRPVIELYDTLTHQMQPLRPAAPPVVGVFTSGPRLVRPVHLGQWRTLVFEDLLLRQLARLGYEPRRVMGLCDVEDALVAQAGQRGRSLAELTGPAEAEFMADRARLRLAPGAMLARTSGCVPRAAAMVEILLEKGLAYRHGGDVFFDPLQFEGFGKLSGLDLSRWPKPRRRFHCDGFPNERLPRGDFILWHGWRAKDGQAFWDTDLGRGRPAPSVQEPAVLSSHLGYTLDIVCGGVQDRDGQHEATLAVMESLSCQRLAGHWLHCAELTAGRRKMSARGGNAPTLGDLLATGASADSVRFFLLSAHYRQPLAFSPKALVVAGQRLADLQRLAREVTQLSGCADRSTAVVQELVTGLEPAFDLQLCADLDLPGALAGLERQLTELAGRKKAQEVGPLDCGRATMALSRLDAVTGFLFPTEVRAANAA
jgi:cysteinyl-tRNA synthetase